MNRTIVAAALLAFASPDASSAQHVSFFPSRPPHAVIRTYAGTIESFGFGTGRGELTIRDARGRTISFALAYPYAIDGRTISCHRAPRPGYRPPRALCADWPASVVLGRSRVRVASWLANDDGVPTLASDAFRSE